ncbi:MAG: hypothetical protein PT959_09550, partial [Firmicutes bacterium]|nr:hypothetical protein [Bacillota bacterium]
DAYTHDEAMRMILEGECGSFNPLLLECLKDIQDDIKREINYDAPADASFGSHIISTNNIAEYNESQLNENGGGEKLS